MKRFSGKLTITFGGSANGPGYDGVIGTFSDQSGVTDEADLLTVPDGDLYISEPRFDGTTWLWQVTGINSSSPLNLDVTPASSDDHSDRFVGALTASTCVISQAVSPDSPKVYNPSPTSIGVSSALTAAIENGNSRAASGGGASDGQISVEPPAATDPGNYTLNHSAPITVLLVEAAMGFHEFTDPLNITPDNSVFIGDATQTFNSRDGSTSSGPFEITFGSAYSWQFTHLGSGVFATNVIGSGGEATVNIPPVSLFSFVVNELSVDFTSLESDADGSVVTREWDFGDLATDPGEDPTHVYAAAGEYTVRLTVWDNVGASHYSEQTVNVLDADYYIDFTGGDDAENGTTPALAKKTIAGANTIVLTAGQSMAFKRGETWLDEGVSLRPQSSGADANNRMTYTAYGTGANPKISQTANCFESNGKTFIHVENIDFDRSTVSCVEMSTSGDFTFSNCNVSNSGDQNYSLTGTAQAVIEDCTISGAADDGVSMHNTCSATLRRCIVTDNAQGINSAGGNAVTLVLDQVDFIATANVLEHIHVDQNIQMERCTFTYDGTTKGAVVGGGTFTNCLFNAIEGGQTAIILQALNATLTVQNCTLIGLDTGDIHAGGPGAPDTSGIINFQNCAIYDIWRLGFKYATSTIYLDNCNLTSITTTDVDTNTDAVVGDPLFVDQSSDNYRLQSASPCRNAGDALAGGPRLDLDGTQLDSDPDLGSYQFVAP